MSIYTSQVFFNSAETACKLLLLLLIGTLSGCLSSEAENPVIVSVESRAGGTDSGNHKAGVCTDATCVGENCAAAGCHSDDDTQNGAFTISGTAFNYQNLNLALTNSTASVRFYPNPNGEGGAVKILAIDAYGNFYTTETIDWRIDQIGLYPALQDGTRTTYMPRPFTPVGPTLGSCNFCHNLAQPEANPSPPIQLDIKYLRINNGIISNGGSPTNYHLDTNGLDCMRSTCHADGGTAPTFSMAGSVYDSETGSLYALADATIGLFPQECDDQRYGCQPGVSPDLVVFRNFLAKTYAEVDARGHFYTTQPVNWNTAVGTDGTALSTYPTLANYDDLTLCRNIKHMKSEVPSGNAGNCYACHDGITQPLISISGTFNEAERCAPTP